MSGCIVQAAKLHAWSFVCSVYLIQRCLYKVNARAMLLLSGIVLSGHHPSLNTPNYQRETLGQGTALMACAPTSQAATRDEQNEKQKGRGTLRSQTRAEAAEPTKWKGEEE